MIMRGMDERDFDLNLLRLFDALLAERHLTRAARRLGLSQPAASAALARLRRRLGDELFVRGPAGMQPTARAQALALPLASALQQLDHALGIVPAFAAAGAQRSFTLGLTAYATQVLLPVLAPTVLLAAPGVDLRVRSVWVRSLVDTLDAGEVDVAIGAVPSLPARLIGEPLVEESFLAIRGADRAEVVDLAAYAGRPHVLVHLEGDVAGPVDRALAAGGLARRIAVTVPGFLDAAALVETSDVLATLPGRIVDIASRRFRVTTFTPPLELKPFSVQMIWHRRSDPDPASLWMREMIRRAAAKLD